MKLTTVDVMGKQYEVEVDSYGRFSAPVAGERAQASSLEGLVEMIRAKARRSKTRIEVRFFNPNTGTYHTITGKHATTGHWTVSGEGNIKQLRVLPYDAMSPLSNEELAEYKALQEALSKASAAVMTFQNARRINLSNLCAQAMKDAEVKS